METKTPASDALREYASRLYNMVIVPLRRATGELSLVDYSYDEPGSVSQILVSQIKRIEEMANTFRSASIHAGAAEFFSKKPATRQRRATKARGKK